jgi:hypothetical protein
MDPSSSPCHPGRRSDDEHSADRSDLELDVVFALEPVDEAIDVAFAAIRSAQRTLQSVPDNAPSIRLRNEWRTHNVLLRQTIRLVDERVEDLAKAIKRLPRVG